LHVLQPAKDDLVTEPTVYSVHRPNYCPAARFRLPT
jgi:hypothetical protein